MFLLNIDINRPRHRTLLGGFSLYSLSTTEKIVSSIANTRTVRIRKFILIPNINSYFLLFLIIKYKLTLLNVPFAFEKVEKLIGVVSITEC